MVLQSFFVVNYGLSSGPLKILTDEKYHALDAAGLRIGKIEYAFIPTVL